MATWLASRMAAAGPSGGGPDGQRPRGVVDLDGGVGQYVGRQRELGDLADGPGGDGHAVAGDELAGVGELDVEGVMLRAARQHDDEHPGGEDERGERDDPAHPPTGERGLLPQNSCVPTIPMAW